MYLSDKVVNYTHRQQHPQYGKINNPDLDRGDFVFVPKGAKAEPPSASLDEERRRLAEERERLRHERLQAEKQLQKERELLESERQRFEEKKQKLAYVPETAKRPINKLRYGQGPFLIDNFEDKDLWSPYFNDKWGHKREGRTSLKVSADPTQGANGTSCSMKIEYKIGERSYIIIGIGGSQRTRTKEVEKDRSNAYDLSRFKKITFYLKGRKRKGILLKPNRIITRIPCYGKDMRSRSGKVAVYYNEAIIRPNKEWQKIEIALDDLVPSAWTKHIVSNYPLKPDLHNVLNIGFLLSAHERDKGFPDSNTVWIDEITLE